MFCFLFVFLVSYFLESYVNVLIVEVRGVWEGFFCDGVRLGAINVIDRISVNEGLWI